MDNYIIDLIDTTLNNLYLAYFLDFYFMFQCRNRDKNDKHNAYKKGHQILENRHPPKSPPFTPFGTTQFK